MAQDSVSVDRWKYLGGSDIAAVMNLSQFKTRWQLLQEKAQLVDDEFQGNKYTEYGNIMEPVIRAHICDTRAVKFQEGKHYLKFGGHDVRLHTDGEFIDKKKGIEILEVKTTSQIYEDIWDYKTYMVQLLFYMDMLGASFNMTKVRGTLAVYERPGDFSTEFDPGRLHVYHIELDDKKAEELVKDIHKSIDSFYADLEKLKENPFLSQEDLVSTDVKALASRLAEIEQEKDHFKLIEEERKMLEEKLAAALESDGKKTLEAFGYKMTVIPGKTAKTTIVEEFDQEAFKESHPKLWKKFSKETKKTSGGKKVQIKMTRLSNEN